MAGRSPGVVGASPARRGGIESGAKSARRRVSSPLLVIWKSWPVAEVSRRKGGPADEYGVARQRQPLGSALFRSILGRAGFSVHELSRGLEAVAKAREIRPHVVVLDVNLPDTDGHDVCRAIRADPVVRAFPC